MSLDFYLDENHDFFFPDTFKLFCFSSENYLLSSLPIKSNTNQKESMEEKQKKKKISDSFGSALDAGDNFINLFIRYMKH